MNCGFLRAGVWLAELASADKEFIVIVGGEASGKSTLLRIIAGLEEPSSGAVLIDVF